MSIAAKLAAAMLEIDRVPKRGRNDYQNYDYMLEGDMFAAVRSALANAGVAVVPSVVEIETLDGGRILVKMEIRLMDGDEVISSIWIGEGNIKSGGVYAAYTGALKYWCQKTFLISTSAAPLEPMDPERFDTDLRGPDKAPSTVKRIEHRNGLQGEVWALLGELDIDPKARNTAARAYIRFRYKAHSTAKLEPEQLEEFRALLDGMTIDERLNWIKGWADES